MGVVSGGPAKFETTPIPIEPVTPKPWVYLHLYRTLDKWYNEQQCTMRCSGNAMTTAAVAVADESSYVFTL